ncbi:MAG: hypothetical protein MK008_10465 [Bdellovibrionales bacterium]|nr:hypothetical protein [Bdellovibrionales bacterium]
MNKSIVYFLVLSSFIVGCGQGFEGNLAKVKDAAPFDESVDAQDSQQQTDTTRPLQDNLQPSSDEEGVGVIYNIDENADGNYNNNIIPGTYEYYLYVDRPYGNEKTQSKAQTPSAQFSITNDTPSAPTTQEKSELDTVETQTAQYSVTNDTPGKPVEDIAISSDEEGESVASNTTAENLITEEELTQNTTVQQSLIKSSKCSLHLFDRHNENINNHIQYYTESLSKINIDSKLYRFVYTLDCTKIAYTAGSIFENYKKIIENPVLAEIRYGRGGRKRLRQAIAKLVKYKSTVNTNGPIDIKLNLYDSFNPNQLSKAELTNIILKNPGIVIPISSSEKVFKNWIQAVRDAVLQIK